MTDDQIIYSIGKDMTRFEMQTGMKPDAIVVSEDIERTLGESRWLIAQRVEKNGRITAENRLLCCSLFMNRSLDSEMYIIGMKCVLERKRKPQPIVEIPDQEGDE